MSTSLESLIRESGASVESFQCMRVMITRADVWIWTRGCMSPAGTAASKCFCSPRSHGCTFWSTERDESSQRQQ
eukprot:952121-Pleurochrysis_carterae.AAC.3